MIEFKGRIIDAAEFQLIVDTYDLEADNAKARIGELEEVVEKLWQQI